MLLPVAGRAETSGRLLAEDMGLGKTLEVICLTLAHPAPVAWVAASRRRIKATLVVAPPSLLSQWARECRHRAPQLKVLEYGLQATDGVLRQRGSRGRSHPVRLRGRRFSG